MVGVVSSPKSLFDTLSYNFRKVERGEGEVLFQQGISVDPYTGKPSLRSTYEDMMLLIPKETRVKKITFSCSLNPDPKEKLSDEQLVAIGREYMEQMGYGGQPFVIIKHTDIEREHIHIISTRVDRLGKKIPDNHERLRSRSILDKLEVKYNLIQLPKKKSQVLATQTKPVDSQATYLSIQVRSALMAVVPHGYYQSIGELNALLKHYNLMAEWTKSEYKGKLYEGVLYSVIDEQDNKVGKPMSGSEMGRGLGISALKNKMLKSKRYAQEALPAVRTTVNMVMATHPKTTQEMKTRLKAKGMDVLFRVNGEGRLYGVTFIDPNKKLALNGSRLGKGYSANVFNAYFQGDLKWGTQLRTEIVKGTTTEQETVLEPTVEDTLSGDLIGTLAGTHTPGDGRDYTEEAWQRKLRGRIQRKERHKKE